MKKRVYIAGPISRPDTPDGLEHNVRQADQAMLALMKAGFAVFNPMLSVFCGGVYRAYLGPTGDDSLCEVRATADRKANGEFATLSHQDWLDMDFAWVAVSDAVLRLPGESKGADMEVAFAAERGVPVFYSIEGLLAHFQGGDK